MSLIAWYPLISDFNDYSGNSNTLTYYSDSGLITSEPLGKIGSCYKRSYNGSTDALRAANTINLKGKSFTMCCWAYVSAVHSGTANGLVTNHSHATDTGAGITVKDVSASDYRISCNTGNGSNRTFNTYYGTSNIKNKWSHLIVQFDNKTNNLSLWVNGVKEYEMTYAMVSKDDYLDVFNWSTSNITSNNYRPACKINDVRIYDEVISIKEIKEIAKAKILHYTFNDFQDPTVKEGAVRDNSGFSNDTYLFGPTDAILIPNSTVVIDGNNVNKSGVSSSWDSGCLSQQVFYGDCFMEYSMDYRGQTTQGAEMVGFNSNHTTWSYTDIDFAIYTHENNNVYVYENGSNKGTMGSWDLLPYNKFRIEIISGVVTYYHNDTLIYTSLVTPTFPIYVDMALHSHGGPNIVTNIKVGALSSATSIPEYVQAGVRSWGISTIHNDFMRQALNGSTTINTSILNDYLAFNPTTTGWVGLYSQDRTYENFEISAELSTDSNHVGIGFSNPNSGNQCDGYQWCIRLDVSGSSDDSRIQKWSTGSQTYIGSGSGGFSTPVDFQQNVWNNIRLVVNNGIAIGYINDVKCIEVNIKSLDTTFNVGYVGLVCYETVGSSWRNVKITDLNKETKLGSGCYQFDGTNQHIPNLKTPIPTEPYSYMMWARPTINMGSTRRNLMVGSGPVWNPGLWADSTTLRGHSYNEYRTKTISWNINEWHMVGQVFDGTNCYLIWDGQLTLDSYTSYSPPNNSDLYIGAEVPGGNTYNWVGDIDDVRIYATALSATDVLEIYNTRAQLDIKGNLYLNELKYQFPKSAYEIQQKYPTATSGVYTIQPDLLQDPILAYCDMDTAGGGWTLLVCSESSSGWDTTNVKSRNSNLPSITSNYSILDKGDYIKSNIGGNLEFRMDATTFGRWGGVFIAPYSYTFTKTDNTQTGITKVIPFDTWEYHNSSIEQRMPYLGASAGLLTTSAAYSSAWWGSLVSNAGYNPAPYISYNSLGGNNENPGIIWYWVR